ncbi:hypothetical protein QYE76_004044 [Lolium multiflorum]|uniref:Protein kinase domain-containing protein n=1 Tax=Lolium multiflorum TaxID=4521 RepID=A0AAD8RRZ0_LOLMU|nr:hypothetical protein QYE76_004044 [Lolium multiflorum]
MTMPWQYSQLLPILLLLATTHTIVAADTQQQPIALAGCPDKCGNISIPFPFGTKAGCFREGFEVTCNYSFNPPRAFLAQDSTFHIVGYGNYSANYSGRNYVDVMNYSQVPVELLDISASTSELRGYGAVRSDCIDGYSKYDDHLVKLQGTFLGWNGPKPFLLSPLRNVLMGVGWNVKPKMVLGGSIFTTTGYMLACLAYMRYNVLTNGTCTGRGCCQTSFPPERDVNFTINAFSVTFEPQKLLDDNDGMSTNSPCSYGMIVESSWYNFTSEDMFGRMVLANKYPRGVPFVLDFAIRNGSCPTEGQQPPQDYACISGNSNCAKAASGDGYVCRCWDNYDGNPYITNGCQDVDECQHPHLYNCSSGSICKNTPGGYECPCKSGMRGNGKEGACSENFPLPAKVAVGLAASIVIIVLMVMTHQLLKLKRFYEQNGGPILKGVKNIRIYTSKQLKQITDNYKVVIGEGHFGKVYIGRLEDKQEVAIKKTIEVDETSKQDFIDEVIIQSGMRHKNIVRLLGCCLEMDVPMLMYEYVVKGSLYDVLFKNKDNVPVDTRLRIAIGSAEGLAYMHSSDVKSTIRHGDVKSANILLDESFTPKISDFGTSKLLARGKSEKTEWVIGDKSYIDPAYLGGILTQKSDVYSFGIVLIELITRREATYDDKRTYVTNFIQACQEQKARNSIDNDITSEKDIVLMEMVSEVALECLKANPEERLDMREVENRIIHIIRKSEQHGQDRNYQGNLRPNSEVPLLKPGEK